tara:strand:+ start:442 stop:732 length:291 start_codon:yes stop_codon:yes gene_type:complete
MSFDIIEINLWTQYLSMEPRGDDKSDWHAAQVTQSIYTILSSFSKNQKPPKLNDCLLKFESERPKSDNKKNIMIMKAMFKNKIDNISEYDSKLKSL